jgi:hypothetical protein
MASVDSCHADLGLATVPCSDEVLTQLQKVSVATLFQILHRLGFPAHLSDRSVTADVGAALCRESLYDALPASA